MIAGLRAVCVACIIGGLVGLAGIEVSKGSWRTAAISAIFALANLLIFWPQK